MKQEELNKELEKISQEMQEEQEEEELPLIRGAKKIMEVSLIDITLEGYNTFKEDKKTLKDKIVTRVSFNYLDNNANLQRITYKPFKYVGKQETLMFGFTFNENKRQKGISFEELPEVIIHLKKAIEKKEKVNIRTTITPFIKQERTENNKIKETVYNTLNWSDLNGIERL
jgi:hypothetical protein